MERKMTQAQIRQFADRLREEEKSRATIQKYIRDLESFFSFAGESEITKEMAVRYKEALQRRYKPVSVNSMLAAVNRFFREMEWYDCVVKTVKVQRQTFRDQERELTREEYFRLLSAARKQGNTRLYLLMQTLCATGIRVSELQFITVEAVRCGRAAVSLKGKTRTVLLPSDLCRVLDDYAEEQKIGSGSIFVTKHGNPMERSNILHEMKGLCDTAGVEPRKVFPHNLRHLFACQYYQMEKDLSRLADILGHANVNTTRIYTCVSGDEQLRQIEQLGLVVCDVENAGSIDIKEYKTKK